jgi:hypothetical protein
MTGIVVLAAASDPRPDDNNVVAGWVGFAIVIALILAVVVILRSFTKQLKKVDAARDAGVYDADDQSSDGPDEGPAGAPDDDSDDADGRHAPRPQQG